MPGMSEVGPRLRGLWGVFRALPAPAQAAVIAAVVVVALLLLLLALVGRSAGRLRRASRRGRAQSAAQAALPPTNFGGNGLPSDPLNIRVVGTVDQLSAALVAAGWYRADEITLITSLRITLDAIFARKYSTAPVSDLYLFGRKQDLAYEKPGKNVRMRDHVRFWASAEPGEGGKSGGAGGRPLWIGAATRDAKVELSKTDFLPTHGIAPDVDDERTLLADDLIATGWVTGERYVPCFPGPTTTKNAMGDSYHTDGRAILLTLARVQPVPVLPRLIRQPVGALARGLARVLRGRLPQEGRDLARAWRRDERGHEPSAPGR